MCKVLVITDPEIGIGFKLAGVEVMEVATSSEAEALLKDCLTDDRYGMILINEDYVSDFEQKSQILIEESTIPLIIPLPIRMKWEIESAKSTYVDDLVRRSVGYQIRLR